MADSIQTRLVGCFLAVFPEMTQEQIVQAGSEQFHSWDSIQMVTLASVIEEEFGGAVADGLGDVDSFAELLEHVEETA